MPRIVTLLRRMLYMLMTILLLALTGLYVFLNTSMGERILKSLAERQFAMHFNGRLTIERAELSLPTSLTLHRVKVFIADDSTESISFEQLSLSIARVSLYRNIEEGLIEELHIGRVWLHRPRVLLVQERDSTLRFMRLLKPDSTATGHMSESRPIKFLIDEIAIRNGEVWWINQLAPKPDHETAVAIDSLRRQNITPIHFDSLHLADVNLLLKGELNGDAIAATLQELSFRIPEADFSVSEASCRFLLTPQRVEIREFVLKTLRSEVRMSAALHQYNRFASSSEERFKQTGFELELNVAQLALSDVKRLLPKVYFLDGDLRARAVAQGVLDSFKVEELSLQVARSRIGLSGTIKHAFTPEKSELNVVLQNTCLTLADIASLMPSIEMPDVSEVGQVVLSGSFNGRLDRFRSQLAVQSQVGNLTADVEVVLPKNQVPEYAGVLRLEHFNLGRAVKNPALASDLNLSAKLSGSGNSLETLRAKFIATLKQSQFGEYTLSEVEANASVAERQIEGKLSIAIGEQLAEFSGTLDLSKETPIYSGQGRLERVDISPFIKNDSLRSALTLRYTLHGRGFGLSDMNLDFDMELDSSVIGKLPIRKGTRAKVKLVQNPLDSSAMITFYSEWLDVEVEGKFDLAQLLRLVELESGVIEREIYKNNIFRTQAQEEAFQAVSKRVKTLEKSVKARSHKVEFPTISAKFYFSLKSLETVSLIAKAGYFNARGQLQGRISSQPNECAISVRLSVDSTTYSDMFFTQNFNAVFEYADVIAEQEHSLRAKLSLNAFRLKMGNQRFLDTKLEMRYDRQAIQVELNSSHINTRGKLEMEMLAGVFNQEYTILLEKFKFATNEFSWEADEHAELQVSPQKVRFRNVAFRNKDQELVFKGYLEFDGDGHVSLALRNFNLADLRRSFLPESFNAPFGGRVNIWLDVTGNLQHPEIKFELDVRNLIYRSVKAGDLRLQADYRNKWVEFVLAANLDTAEKSHIFREGEVMNRLSGRGRIPINLDSDGMPFGLVEGQEVFAEIRSDDLAASALEAFVPVERTSGFIKLRATVRGRWPKPDVRINLTIDQVKITPVATKVEYTISGELVATPSGARWAGLSIKDRFGGEGLSSGTIRMNNFTVEFIDIAFVFNRLHLMRKPESKDGSPFGTLVASSDNLRYFGTLEAPKLTGQLLINNGDLSSFAKNASNATEFAEAAKFITMRPREDTTLTLEERNRIKKERQLREEFSMSEAQERLQAYQVTLYDLLTMDLRIRTQRRMLYTIIFNKYLGEQLKVSLEDVDIRLRKRGISLEAFGSATIAGGSYTAFTKNFEVKPGGKISWNEEEVLNATLDVTAETRIRANNPDPRRAGVQAEVFLIVKITGKALAPNMAMGYRFEELEFKMPNTDLPGLEDPNTVLNFALLLSAGQWYSPPVELGGSGSGLGTGTVASAGIGAGTGLLSSQLSRVASTIAGVQAVNIGLARDASGAFSGVDLTVAYAVPGTDGKLIIIGSGSFANNDSALVRGGNINSQKLEYRISDKVILEAFRIFGQNNFTIFNQEMQELWGIGIGYRDNFHTWSELSDRIFRRRKAPLNLHFQKKKTEQLPPPDEPTDEPERASHQPESKSAQAND